MSAAPPDPVAWLLPEESDAARERARRVTTFLRLFAADARPHRAEVVGLDVPRVRHELERLGRESRLGWTLVLLRHHVHTLLPADSFLVAPRPTADPVRAQREWMREHELAGEEPPWRDPHPPARAHAEGLLRILRALAGASSDESRVFDAFLAHATRGPEAGERCWRALATGGDGPAAALGATGVAAALLERGRVADARRWIAERRARQDSAGLLRLDGWAEILERGTFEKAPSTAPDAIALPGPLRELRERIPRLAAALEGKARHGGAPRALPFEHVLRETGAVAFVVFVLAGGVAVPVHWALAPRLRGSLDGLCSARSEAHRTPGQPEHELVRTGRGQVRDRVPGVALGTTLSPRARAVAREPFVDRRGDVRGWFHLELEHHLVPVAAARRALGLECAARVQLAPEELLGQDASDVPDARAHAARALLASLGKAAARRRWWIFEREGEAPVLTGGGDLGAIAPGRAGIVRRVRAEGAASSFAGPCPALSCHAGAASGAAVPLVFAGRVHGVLAVESSRRAGLPDSVRARMAEAASRHGAAWRAAQFVAWHAQRFARPVAFRLDGNGWRVALPVLGVAARRREPIGLHGPPGVGRIVVARWLHFEGPGPLAPLDSLRATSEVETLARIAGCRPGSTLVLATDALTPAVRAALAERRRDEREAPVAERTLLILLARREGELRDALPCLVRHTLRVPPLAERRDELPALLTILLAGACPLPRAGLSLLWRQAWTANLPELSAFLAAACSLAGGAPLTPELLHEVARRTGRVLLLRLPTRPADRPGRAAALEAALALSRRPGGRLNKRRAAELLGWDPATLAQHAPREDS